jgi:hypothetical protein
MSQITLHDNQRRSRPNRRIACVAAALFVSFLIIAEEARYGYILGRWGYLCESAGGKFASTEGRCVTRACYWFDDCGRWVHPTNWRENIKPGDSVAKVVFWLGRPGSIEGNTYFWGYGKADPDNRLFSTTFQNGKFVEWHDDVIPSTKLKTN